MVTLCNIISVMSSREVVRSLTENGITGTFFFTILNTINVCVDRILM